MWPDRLAWSVAIRSLAGSGRLTALTLVVVGVSAVLVIFLTSLIEGLRVQLVDETTAAIPHVVIRPFEEKPTPPSEFSTETTRTIGQRASWTRQTLRIDDWRRWVTFARAFDPSVTAVSPTAESPGFAARGAQERPVRLYGVDPRAFDEIVAIQSNLERGKFFRMSPGECVIGTDLADKLGVDVGGRLRVTTSEGTSSDKRISGVFRTGFSGLDEGALLMPLGDAQSLLGIGSSVTNIGLKVDDVFEAKALAERLQLQVPYEVRDWTADNQRLLGALEAQKRSSDMITFFTAIAAAFAIASILIVLVSNKLKEIGILKAMGAGSRQIRTIFALQGTLLAAAGGVVGAAAGVALVVFLSGLEVDQAGTGRTESLFPFALSASVVVGTIAASTLLGFLASIVPARHAARVDPIEVIRG